MEIKELRKDEWDTFIKKAPNSSVYQTSEYGLANAKEYKPLFVGLVDNNNNTIAGALILIQKEFGFNYGYIPRGFIIDYNNFKLLKIFTEQLKNFLLKYNLVAIKLSPPILKNDQNKTAIVEQLKKLNYWHFGYNDFFEALNARYEAVLTIEKPLEQIFYDLNKTCREKIESAAKQGVVVYRGGAEDLTILYNQTKKQRNHNLKYFQDLYLHFNRNAQISVYYAKINTGLFLKNIQKKYREQEEKANEINEQVSNHKTKHDDLINEKIKLDQALAQHKELLVKATTINNERPEGINAASALVITHKTKVYILIEGSLEKYKSFYPQHMLYWKIIEKYQNLGYQKLYLGGITNPQITDNPYQAHNDFKLSFNANIEEYIGDFELIINRSKYYLFKKSKSFSGILKK